MMSVWHLLWIVPLSASLGLFVGALCNAAKDGDYNED